MGMSPISVPLLITNDVVDDIEVDYPARRTAGGRDGIIGQGAMIGWTASFRSSRPAPSVGRCVSDISTQGGTT